MDARGVLVLALGALAAGDALDANHTGKIVAPHVPEVKKQGFMAAIKSNLQRNNEEYEEEGAVGGGGGPLGGPAGGNRSVGARGARRLGPPPQRPHLPRMQPHRPREQMLEGTWGREAPNEGAAGGRERPRDVEGDNRQLEEVIEGRKKNKTPGERQQNVIAGEGMVTPPVGQEWAGPAALREGGDGAAGEGEGAGGEGEGAPGEGEGPAAVGGGSGVGGANYDTIGEPERERVPAAGAHRPRPRPSHGHMAPPRAPPAGGGGEGDAGGAWDGGDSPEPAGGGGGSGGRGGYPGAAVRGRADAEVPRGVAAGPGGGAGGADINKVEKLRSFLRNNKDVLKKFILQKRKQKLFANSPPAPSAAPMTFTAEATSHTPMTFTPDANNAPMTFNPPRAPVGVLTGQQMAPPWLRGGGAAVGVGVGEGGGGGGKGAGRGGGGVPLLDGRGLHALDLSPARGSRIDGLRQHGRLCQRSVLMPEGPKYDSKGAVYLLAYNRTRYGGRDYSQTKPPRLLLPICCNCCKKSVLGCE